jgi:hypothetical protein
MLTKDSDNPSDVCMHVMGQDRGNKQREFNPVGRMILINTPATTVLTSGLSTAIFYRAEREIRRRAVRPRTLEGTVVSLTIR